MKNVEIRKLAGGYLVTLTTKDSKNEYVYSDDKELLMMNTIGTFLIETKIKTERG